MASILDTVKDLGRLREIVQVLIRHGFGEIVQRTGLGSLVPGKAKQETKGTLAERIRLVITDLGPSFVKLGQILSTRPDLVPQEIIEELKHLQDQVPPVPYAQIEKLIQLELGAPIDQLFVELDPEPLASASIGQVHRAKLETADGSIREVVVKCQRPNIKETIERDIDLLYWLAKAVERSMPEARTYQPMKLVTEFDRAITAELDFTLEAENAIKFGKNFETVSEVRFPFIYREASAKRVLTLEFFDGHKIYAAIEHGYSGEKICKNTLALIVKAVFEDGFFHADPHPGNFIILGAPQAPVIGAIDLGLIGRLTPQMREKTIDLMIAAVQEDYRGLADALYAIGTPTRKVDRRAFEAEVARLADRYLGKQLQDIQISRLVQDLGTGATKFGLEIPPDFLLVGKALMTVEGVGKEIYPELDVFQEMKPYFMRLMWARYSPERLTQDLVRTMTRISGAATDLPIQTQEVLDDLRRGRLEMRMREPNLPVSIDVLGRRIYSGLVVMGLLISSGVLFASGGYIFGTLFTVAALSWGTLHMGWSMWLNRKSRRK